MIAQQMLPTKKYAKQVFLSCRVITKIRGNDGKSP
jgi:hypothetical protein